VLRVLSRTIGAVPYFRAKPPSEDTDYFTVWLDYEI
jgi:hypothetical protein